MVLHFRATSSGLAKGTPTRLNLLASYAACNDMDLHILQVPINSYVLSVFRHFDISSPVVLTYVVLSYP
jgi:hypothetical protein